MTKAPKLDPWRLVQLLENDRDGDWSDASLVEALKTIAVLADDELAAAEQRYEIDLKKMGDKQVASDDEFNKREDKFKKERVDVWALLVDGLQVVLKKSGTKSKALDHLLSALIETVRGNKVPEFRVIARGLTDIATVFNQALIIAALEQHPEKRDQIISRGARLLGKKRTYVSKLIDNYHQERLRPEVRYVVMSLKSFLLDDGINVFGKLIS